MTQHSNTNSPKPVFKRADLRALLKNPEPSRRLALSEIVTYPGFESFVEHATEAACCGNVRVERQGSAA